MWQEFLTALALVFVIEGIMPFINPAGYRKTLRSVSELNEKVLRRVGLVAMLAGLALLYVVR